MHKSDLCPCGSGSKLEYCCKSVIENDTAASAEILMRSRYTAYVLGYWGYLHTSWHSDTRPSAVSPIRNDWLGLTIVNSSQASVEFIAGFREHGKIMALHEISRFAQADGHWRYLDGICDISEADCSAPCPCGSILKTKHCCGKI